MKTVLTGAGIAVAGTGALLMWMGLKDYTVSNVLDAALRGADLVPAHELKGVIGNIQKPESGAPAPEPHSDDKLTPVNLPAVFDGVDGIDWGGSVFS